MKRILQKHCLVLNKSWVPCNTVPIRRAIGMAIKGRGKIIHPSTFNLYTFDEWVEKEPERSVEDTFRFKGIVYDIPTIICAIHYSSLHVKYTQLDHEAIYRRDGNKCVYCGSKINLTWDHVIPECIGGKTTWTNLVTCCKKCNNHKDNMSVEEFCQIKNCKIPRPVSMASTPWLSGRDDIRPEWECFIK